MKKQQGLMSGMADVVAGKDWRTTVFALIAAVALFINSHPQYASKLVADIAGYVAAGGLAGLGIFAKDKKPPPVG